MEGFAYGFSTYVFIERNSANSAVLHPYPETKIEAVRDALDDAGYDMEILGKGDINTGRERAGEGIYFTEQPFPDEVLGDLADALIVRGFGAFAYSLIESSFDSGAKISLFTRMGKNIVEAGNRVIMTHMYIGEIEGKKEARPGSSVPRPIWLKLKCCCCLVFPLSRYMTFTAWRQLRSCTRTTHRASCPTPN